MMSYLKLHFVIVLLVLVASVIGYVKVYALVRTESAASVRLAEELQTKQKSNTRSTVTATERAEIQKDETVVNDRFISSSGTASFVDELQTLGRSLGTTITAISISPDPNAAHPETTFSLKVTGQFASVVRTLGAIENAPYYVRVQQASILKDISEVNANVTDAWTATIDIVVGTRTDSVTTSNL